MPPSGEASRPACTCAVSCGSVTAAMAPIVVTSRILACDGVLVLLTAIAFSFVGWFWTLDRFVGILFIAMLIAYIVYAWRQESVGNGGHTAAFEKAEAT